MGGEDDPGLGEGIERNAGLGSDHERKMLRVARKSTFGGVCELNPLS
jgi:hypothetical protein